VPDLADLRSAEFWRAHARQASYVTLALLGFLVFLTATFPYQAAFESALRPLGLSFSSSGQGFALPAGALLYDVRVVDTRAADGRALLESPQVRIAPALGEMLLLRAAVKVSAALYDGDVTFRVWRSGDATALDFNVSDLNLTLAGLDSLIGAAVGGILTTSGDMRIDPIAIPRDSGSINFAIKDANLSIAHGLQAVSLGALTGKLQLDHGILEIADLRSTGGDLAISARGEIRVVPNLMNSQLDLQFDLVPTAAARKRLNVLLNLLPHPPGTQPYHLTGTVSVPSLT